MRVDLLEKLAVHNVLDESIGRYIELAYRHYSMTYHTPLHIAKEVVPEEEVLLIYFEDRLEGQQPDELSEMIAKMYKTVEPEVLNANAGNRKAGISDDEWVAKMNMKVKQQQEAKQKSEAEKQAVSAVKEVDAVIEKFNKSMRDIKQKADKK